MEELRIREKNIINIRIRELNSYISKNEDTLKRLNSQAITSFVTNQINKIEVTIQEYTRELESLKEKLANIISGNLDSVIKQYADNNKSVITKKSDEKMAQKIEEKNIKKAKEQENLQKSYSMNRTRNNREPSEWEMEKEYSRYCRLCDSIPEYILRNLKEMPGNKGYIWKGLWCFGQLKEEPHQPMILFEKLRNDIMHIHEIDKDFRKIYEKQGKNGRRVLISTEKRLKNK